MGRATKTLRPSERVLEATKHSPSEMKIQQWRQSVAQRSIYLVKYLPLRCRHSSDLLQESVPVIERERQVDSTQTWALMGR